MVDKWLVMNGGIAFLVDNEMEEFTKQCGGVVGSQGTRYEQNKGINQQNRGFLGIKKGRKRED